jgi:hypothetical protein
VKTAVLNIDYLIDDPGGQRNIGDRRLAQDGNLRVAAATQPANDWQGQQEVAERTGVNEQCAPAILM